MLNIDIHRKTYYFVIDPKVLESLHEKVGLAFRIVYKTKCLLKIILGHMPDILDNWRKLKHLVKITYSSHRVLRKLCLYWGLTYKRPSYDYLIAEGPRMIVENHFLAGSHIHTCIENLDPIDWRCTIYDAEIQDKLAHTIKLG